MVGTENSGNPEAFKVGVNTQFGKPGAPDPREAGKKGGEAERQPAFVRAELRYLSLQEINDDPDQLDKELKRLAKRGKGKTTLARMLAVRMFEKAVKQTDSPMCNTVIENIEGRLPQEINIPQSAMAPTNVPTLEEAERVMKEFMGK